MPPKRPRPPLNSDQLRELALHYVGRFATSRAKLIAYLNRKIHERGWEDEKQADPNALADRFSDLGYIDDAAFATMRGASLSRRGYGARRITETLRADGIDEVDRQQADAQAQSSAWQAAERFARRQRIGPFASAPADKPQREKQIAAFLRAGHSHGMARKWVDAMPDEPPEAPDE